MLELLDELRAHDFTIGIVTGGGTEFVRQVSKRCYGVEPGMVVGTLIGYEFDRDDAGRPVVRRTISQIGSANEGGAKIEHIQSQIGRPPILAVGNSGGDREMLEWAQASRHGGLAVLIDHDDAEREFAYESTAVTFQDERADHRRSANDSGGWSSACATTGRPSSRPVDRGVAVGQLVGAHTRMVEGLGARAHADACGYGTTKSALALMATPPVWRVHVSSTVTRWPTVGLGRHVGHDAGTREDVVGPALSWNRIVKRRIVSAPSQAPADPGGLRPQIDVALSGRSSLRRR